MVQNTLNRSPNHERENPQAEKILAQLQDKQLLVVNSRRRNGLIICKRYHAEFAGPGSAIGGFLDYDAVSVVPVGSLSLVVPESSEEKQRAYLIRRQWIRFTKQITDNPVSLQRAQMILNQFEHFFDPETVAKLPDRAFALSVGVLPKTIRKVRNPEERLEV